jgi:prepilin-type N-terminal cleavage/methylation domain-containing protein
MKKNGFTLLELLAVIVILAVIIAIAIPSISTMMNGASKNAFESSAKLVLKAVDLKRMEDSSFDLASINENTIKTTLNIDNSNYETLTVKKVNGEIYVTIIGKNKWAGLTVSGTETASSTYNTVLNYVRGANAPVLVTGMTPIKWDGSSWIDTTEADPDWYNYDITNKQWANARTADGSMWVWIPRFVYKISSGWYTSTVGTIDIHFTKGVDDNWDKAVIGDIVLDESSNASNGTWTNHPAFTFGSTELTGFWVAKFEASGTTSAIDFKPNVASLRSITIDSMFTASRKMEINTRYGWDNTGDNIDTHMMKNSEWGAVAYLSKSVYGKNDEIWINPSDNFTTGCAGDSVSSGQTTGCLRTYDTENGMQASTTGNIYGIYDMSGGSWEYVPAYINNKNSRLIDFGNSVIQAPSKYKDVYTVGSIDTNVDNYALAINSKGEALYETSTLSSSWYGDYSDMPTTYNPWFARGGRSTHGSYAGAFHFYSLYGGADSTISLRVVVLAGAGL